MTAELLLCRSPAAIAADLAGEGGASVCHESIYRAVYGGELDVAARDCLRRRLVDVAARPATPRLARDCPTSPCGRRR